MLTNKKSIKTKNKESNKKSTQDGNSIIEYFEKKKTELEKVQDNWTQQNQLYCILKIYLTYGVLRPSELLHCSATEKDWEDIRLQIKAINYINPVLLLQKRLKKSLMIIHRMIYVAQ